MRERGVRRRWLRRRVKGVGGAEGGRRIDERGEMRMLKSISCIYLS
jgi:hypothetical protein